MTFMVFIWNGGSLKTSSVHPGTIMRAVDQDYIDQDYISAYTIVNIKIAANNSMLFKGIVD